jgi:hypothetical protein
MPADRFNMLPKVGEAQLPGNRMAPIPQGAFDTTQAQQNLGIIREEQGKINFYDAVDALTKLKDWENKTDYEGVLGENARELPKRMQQEYQKQADQLANGLSDPNARAMFQRKAAENGVQFLGAVERHSLRQKTVAEAQKTDAFVSTWQDAGIKAGASGNYADMEKAANEIDGIWRIHGKENGIPPVAVDEAIKKDNSKLYSGAIRLTMDSGDDLAAKRMYDEKKGFLVGNDALTLARDIEAGSYRGQAQREVARIFTGKPTLGQAPTERDTFAEVDKIEDPKLQDMVRARVREKWEDQKRMDHDAMLQDSMTAANLVAQSKTMDSIPVDLLERLPLSTRNSLDEYAKDLRRGLQPSPVSDDYLTLSRMSAVDPQGFAKLDPSEWRGKITDAEVKELTGEQTKILKGDGSKNKGFLTVEEIANQRVKTLSMTDAKDIEQLKLALNRDYINWKRTHDDKEPKPEEAEAMVDHLIGSEARWYTLWLGQSPMLKFTKYEDIPTKDRTAIEAALKEKGQEVTPGRVTDLYRKQQGK